MVSSYNAEHLLKFVEMEIIQWLNCAGQKCNRITIFKTNTANKSLRQVCSFYFSDIKVTLLFQNVWMLGVQIMCLRKPNHGLYSMNKPSSFNIQRSTFYHILSQLEYNLPTWITLSMTCNLLVLSSMIDHRAQIYASYLSSVFEKQPPKITITISLSDL